MTAANTSSADFGEVFTRRWIVELILDLVGYTSDRDLSALRLVEPSVGSGAFFIPIVERLIVSARRHGKDLVSLKNALFGIDLQKEHVDTCRRRTIDLLVQSGISVDGAQEIAEKWLQHGDFLLSKIPGGADFVVGNPPYIRTENLDNSREKLYRKYWKTMRGRSDIYIGFYERGLDLLAEEGRLGFICADRWMHNAYGTPLRELITTSYAVESIWHMHSLNSFESEVSAYPAITVLANKKQAAVSVINTEPAFDGQGAHEALEFACGSKDEGIGSNWEGARISSWFKTSDFWPVGAPNTIKLLESLQEKYFPLDSDGQTRISIGVATGADKAYIIDKDAFTVIEEDRLLPLVTTDDIRSGYLKQPKKLLLNPWDEEGQLIDLEMYPQFAKALEAHPEVRTRYIAKRNPDKWYRTIDKVHPGLVACPKLLFQDMKINITPVLEPGGYYPHHNLYYIVSTSWDLEVLGGLLLSRVAEAFVRAYGVKMRGGTMRFQAQYLRKIVVPRPEQIPSAVADRLRSAFQTSNREEATRAAEEAYGLPAGTI